MGKTTKTETIKTIILNISYIPSDNWVEEQKQGFDKIIDISFPNRKDMNKLVDILLRKIDKILKRETKKKNEIYIRIQYTQSSLYSILYSKIADIIENKYKDYKYGIKYASPVIEKIEKFEGWLTYQFQ